MRDNNIDGFVELPVRSSYDKPPIGIFRFYNNRTIQRG